MSLIPDKTSAHLKGRVMHPSIILTRTVVNKNTEMLQDYINSSSDFVKANHFIVKILDSLPLRSDLMAEEVNYMMKGVATRLAPAHGLTHHNNVGSPITGGALVNDEEYYLIVDTPFSSSTDWRELKPLEFLYHEHTNINYRLDIPALDNKMAFLSINLGILAWQFMQWRDYTQANGLEESPLQFVHKYVLGNLIESYNDIAFFNRHLFTLTSDSVTDGINRRDVKLVDTTDMLDKLVANNLRTTMRKSLTLPETLFQIQPPHSDSILERIEDFDMATTLQSEWLLFVRELPYLRYGLLVSKKGINSRYTSNLTRALTTMQRTRIWDKLPKQSSLHIIEKFYSPVLALLSEA